MPPLSRRQPRRLHCKDPRLVNNYIRLFHQYAGPLQLFERVQELERKASTMSRFEVANEYEILDNLRCDTTAFTEKHCRKLRTGQVAFSPELSLSRLRIKAWLLFITKVKKQKVSSRLLARTLKKAQISPAARAFSLNEL